jgi:rubrerythrin
MKKTKAKRKTALTDFMIQAYVMEIDAAERYGMLADQMEVHNKPKVAAFFRKLARIEGLHAERIMKEMGWKTPPTSAQGWMWKNAEAPETAPLSEMHYLMQPWHALEIALECEERAERFFNGIASSVALAEVKRVAREMAADEREHIRLIRQWMKKAEKPEPGWDRDPDPPTHSE